VIQLIDVKQGICLKDYAGFALLNGAVEQLRSYTRPWLPPLRGRTVWMVNSTANGGGVAEMMPKLVGILRELGVKTEWAVIGSDEPKFFALTKRIHNLIHGFGRPDLSRGDVALYERISRELAAQLENRIGRDDVLVIHDPQPMGAGALIKRRTGVRTIWRCHIGLDRQTPATASAWQFLRPHAEFYDHAVFSAPEYVPAFLAKKASIIHPAIDPLSDKNQDLSIQALIGILCQAGLIKNGHPPGRKASQPEQAMRLHPDGTFGEANLNGEIGLLFHPMVTQVSRWDRLKGWEPLVNAFIALKRKARKANGNAPLRYKRWKQVRLLLIGPDPAAIQDDPEGMGVLNDLCDFYLQLDAEDQESVALLTLPMSSRKHNHLMVNAVQRCSTIVVQNSLQEGFGLTATEAMWKRIPVLGTSACGLRQQIRDGIDGLLTKRAHDPQEIGENLDRMMASAVKRAAWGRNAQLRVHKRFLVFSQVQSWLRLLANIAESPIH
jgi:trehalose synthase